MRVFVVCAVDVRLQQQKRGKQKNKKNQTHNGSRLSVEASPKLTNFACRFGVCSKEQVAVMQPVKILSRLFANIFAWMCLRTLQKLTKKCRKQQERALCDCTAASTANATFSNPKTNVNTVLVVTTPDLIQNVNLSKKSSISR